MPTLGAACLIFSGERAWFNRKVLASKIAVFIGLISYPLYLWHWVLLSFLRITEVEKLSELLKISILIISVILAWLTYFFVERKLRFQKSKFVSLGLLIVLLLIGSIGYIVSVNSGYPERFKFEENWIAGEIGDTIFSKKGFRFQQDCIDKYTSSINKNFSKEEFCLIEKANEQPTALLIGDSHANHLYSGLVLNKTLTGGNLLNRGAGSCFPFFDNPENPNKLCQTLIPEFLEMAITMPSIKAIILSGKAVTELNEARFISTDKKDNPYLIFQNGMKKTLQRLTKTEKRIVFILDTPDLEFKPSECVNNRPWRFKEMAGKSPCAVARSQVNLRRAKYLEIVLPILNEFPNVEVFDPLPALCDENYCWAIKDKKMLYRDEHHLNKTGAIYLGEYFKNAK
jgi:hypothetical protein